MFYSGQCTWSGSNWMDRKAGHVHTLIYFNLPCVISSFKDLLLSRENISNIVAITRNSRIKLKSILVGLMSGTTLVTNGFPDNVPYVKNIFK